MKSFSFNNSKPLKRGALTRSTWLLLAISLTGCPSGNQSPGNAPAGKVTIKGSNTFGEELGRQLVSEYQKENPKVTVQLESKGSASGVEALLAGQSDIAAASRVINNGELVRAQSNHIEINCHVVGAYAVSVVVNSANPKSDLNRDQLRDIFTGTIQNWKDVGGTDAPIHLYIRDPISGTYLGFQELAMENKPYAANSKPLTNYLEIVQAVAKDTNGIGYASLDLASGSGVKAVSVRGVAPDVLSVQEGRYPFARSLRLYTHQGQESPATLDFINFIQSPRGQDILKKAGFVPRP